MYIPNILENMFSNVMVTRACVGGDVADCDMVDIVVWLVSHSFRSHGVIVTSRRRWFPLSYRLCIQEWEGTTHMCVSLAVSISCFRNLKLVFLQLMDIMRNIRDCALLDISVLLKTILEYNNYIVIQQRVYSM